MHRLPEPMDIRHTHPHANAARLPGRALVLAGILERQAQELQEAYAPWAALTVADSEDGWILMTARKA